MSTTTPLQIRNNPANTSTSKHQWSFSKSNRFPSPKTMYKLYLLVVAIKHFMTIDLVFLREKPQ